jgi:hypothetical protein
VLVPRAGAAPGGEGYETFKRQLARMRDTQISGAQVMTLSQCGIAIAFTPAAFAAAMPGLESSIAIDCAGVTPRRRAASK